MKEKIIKNLEKIVDITKKCRYNLQGKYSDNFHLFAIGVIERFYKNSVALKILFDSKEVELDLSINIIFRSLLLDALHVELLYKKITTEDGSILNENYSIELDEFCQIVLSDGLQIFYDFLERINDNGIITEVELHNQYNSHAKQHKNFIKSERKINEKPTSKINKKKLFSPNKIFEELNSSPKTKNIALYYENYVLLSKFEHFNIMSLQVKGIPKNEMEEVYLQVTELLIKSTTFLLLLLSSEKQEIRLLHNDISHYHKQIIQTKGQINK